MGEHEYRTGEREDISHVYTWYTYHNHVSFSALKKIKVRERVRGKAEREYNGREEITKEFSSPEFHMSC